MVQSHRGRDAEKMAYLGPPGTYGHQVSLMHMNLLLESLGLISRQQAPLRRVSIWSSNSICYHALISLVRGRLVLREARRNRS